MVVTRAIEALPEDGRAQVGAGIVEKLIKLLSAESDAVDRAVDMPLDPARVLSAILRRRPDGSPDVLEAPLTPLLDTTLLTNSPGEPAVGHELRAEVHSADSIDVVMAFVRLRGINPMLDALRRHCRDGKRLRIVTTTYTNSTELRALDELAKLGAEIKVSYDTASTRLHAKAWLFHRRSGYSTAYIGSSNLTHSAMVTGLEWNVRVSGMPRTARTSSCSPGSAPPIARSGASGRRPTSRTKANDQSHSPGGSITACPATSTPSSPPRSLEKPKVPPTGGKNLEQPPALFKDIC